MAHDVFISYSHKDKSVADAIVNHLENNNVRCWYAPRDIETGQEWAECIMQAIEYSKIMVLIFTDYSNASVQVRREIDNAISKGVTVIPFKLTAEPPSGAMEYYLSTLHWLDAMNEPLEKAIDNLCERVVSILCDKNNPEYVGGSGPRSKIIKKKSRIILGLLSLPILLLGVFLLFCGIVYFIDDAVGGILTAFFGVLLALPGLGGMLMVKNKRLLPATGFAIIGVLMIAIITGICIIAIFL